MVEAPSLVVDSTRCELGRAEKRAYQSECSGPNLLFCPVRLNNPCLMSLEFSGPGG